MANRERKRVVVARLGTALMLAGAFLLGAYFLASGWSALDSDSALSAFEEARAASLEMPEPPRGVPDGSMDSPAFSFDVPQPDYSLWSQARIEEYEASVSSGGDVPRAVLDIGHLDIRVPVYNGADEFNLSRGVARIIGTGRFDLQGNLGIAGHRDGFFRGLKDIRLGDRFKVETLGGETEYVVTSIRIVDPSEVSVLAPTDAPAVTLVTCYPFYFVGHAPKRFIVKGEATNQPVNS